MKYKEIAGRIAKLLYNYDYFGFIDSFDSVDDCVSDLLSDLNTKDNFIVVSGLIEILTEIANNPDATPEEKTEANILIKGVKRW